MLSEPGASRSGNSGLVSSAKRRYLKLVHRKIPVSGHRSRTREPKLVHDTHSQLLWDVVRRSRGPFTHLCRAERGRKSAKRALSPAKTTVLHFRCWSERKVVSNCLYFEHTLLESARFDQCRNRFCTQLYSAVRPDAPAAPSDTARTPRGGASQGGVVQVIPERPRVVLKRPRAANQMPKQQMKQHSPGNGTVFFS